jgi:hypothetical protein
MKQHGPPPARDLLHTIARVGTALIGTFFILLGPAAPDASAQACSPATAGAIGGIVFVDANSDGIRQAGEEGLNGVVLQITGPSGTTQLVTSGGVSSIPGMYSTGGTLCDPGDYTVAIVSVPAGYVVSGPSSQVVTITRDPNTGVLSKKGNLNFALVLEACTSSIGDLVWNDLDADGVQDAGEPGIGRRHGAVARCRRRGDRDHDDGCQWQLHLRRSLLEQLPSSGGAARRLRGLAHAAGW